MMISGCGVLQTTISSAMRDTSTYQPPMRVTSDVDDYFKLVTENSGKVVKDELGIYYHKVTNGVLQRTYFNSTEKGVLRELFSNKSGLLTPVYVYNKRSLKTPQLVVDWTATKRQYNLFTKTLKLKLLPFSETKSYQKMVENDAVDNFNIKGTFNAKTQSVIINKLKVKPDYIITHTGLELFYNRYLLHKRGFDLSKEEPKQQIKIFKEAHMKLLTSMTAINFASTKMLDESKSGFMYFASGCSNINIKKYTERFDAKVSSLYGENVLSIESGADTSSVKNIEKAHRKAELKELKKVMSKFQLSLISQSKKIKYSERACATGFKALKVSGAFKSKSLN